jgi:hypothetical protein
MEPIGMSELCDNLMMEEQFYIYKKEGDWSVLQEGFSIPVSIQVVFKERMKNYLKCVTPCSSRKRKEPA